MKDAVRITIIVVILLVGAMTFSGWALSQFDIALDSFNTPSVPTPPLPPSIHEDAASTTKKLVLDPPPFSFTFPSRDSTVYEGCTYDIAWDASSTIKMIAIELIDAGTRSAMGPVAAGIPKSATTTGSTLPWRVGSVWPGTYLLRATALDSAPIDTKSRTFSIDTLPDTDQDTQSALCKKTGGHL